jgi:capsular exopolysaccharide synthesis family protein
MAASAKRPRLSDSTLIAEADVKSPASEAYRTLRTNLNFADLDGPCRSLVVTSTVQEEGKTTTAANIAVVSAQAGTRVCLVDADLRRPALHRVFGLTNAEGLTTALLDGLSFAKVAQPTRIPNLVVVTSGRIPPNPAEVVGSRRMAQLVETAISEFDLVIFDTPPVISVADAVALAARCEGVLLVIRAGRVPPAVILRAIHQIQAVKGRIIGAILNNVNLQRDGYDYGYYQGYYSGERR